jgi:uncharacterized repeat protein (TIGR02543 family)
MNKAGIQTMRKTAVVLCAVLLLCAGCKDLFHPEGPEQKPAAFTVTFDSAGGIPAAPQTRTVTSGASLGSAMPSNPTRSGHNFGGWHTAVNGGGNEFTAVTTVTGDITVYAWWLDTSIQYTVTFNAAGGIPAAPQTRKVTNGASVGSANMPSAPTREGHNFGGWHTAANGGGDEFTAATTVTGDITVYAWWLDTSIQYTVTFDSAGGIPAAPQTRKVTNGASVGSANMPSAPTREGHSFNGWHTAANGEGDEFTAATQVTANITVYAWWSIGAPVTYTVTFAAAEGDPPSQTKLVTNGASLGSGMPSNPTRSGHSFGGWYTAANGGGSEFTSATPVAANITVYAWWKIQYTVTFDAEGGSPATQTRTVTEGASPGSSGMPSVPTRSGHNFGGWYTAPNGGGDVFTATTVVTNNITLYAQWEKIAGLYKISFIPAHKIGNWNLADSLNYITSYAANGDIYFVVLGADESASNINLSYPGLTVEITLMGDGVERIINLNADVGLFTVANGVTLNLDNNVSLLGRSSNTRPLVTVNSGGTLNMYTGAKISGNTTSISYQYYGGGGVSINGGAFTMSGGEISDNIASSSSAYPSYGGGVYINNGTFTMSGGKISGNTASSSYSSSSYGGGVCINGGTFTMSGGEISGNTASSSYYSYYSYGGGVCIYSGSFIKSSSGGIIYGANAATALQNTAGSDGQAVYISGSMKRNTTVSAGAALDSSVAGAVGGWE